MHFLTKVTSIKLVCTSAEHDKQFCSVECVGRHCVHLRRCAKHVHRKFVRSHSEHRGCRITSGLRSKSESVRRWQRGKLVQPDRGCHHHELHSDDARDLVDHNGCTKRRTVIRILHIITCGEFLFVPSFRSCHLYRMLIWFHILESWTVPHVINQISYKVSHYQVTYLFRNKNV